jgi:DNA-binding IclR family transcriptional regulator
MRQDFISSNYICHPCAGQILCGRAQKWVVESVTPEPSLPATRRVPEQRHIQSVNVGFGLIRQLEVAPNPMSLKELSRAAGMPPSQAHLYLVSFIKAGLVQQEPNSSRYELGPYALQLGLAAMRKLDVIRLARQSMHCLQDRTGEAVFLCVWGNHGPTLVAKVDGTRSSPRSLQIGYVLPVLPTATGRTFLAFLPRYETEPLIEAELAAQRSPMSRATLEEAIAQTRGLGLGRSENLRNDGFAGLCAPIFDHAGAIRATLTISGPASLCDVSYEGANAAVLKSEAGRISQQMGFTNSDRNLAAPSAAAAAAETFSYEDGI